ncbi:HD domain-containing protein [Thermodesulfobacteriota bacterium]
MKAIFEKIEALAKPYLNTRMNDLHTEISARFARALIKEEGGSEDIILPAILLHDVGWKRVPEAFHLRAFGPKADALEWQHIHEKEGAEIAREILRQIAYDEEKIQEVLKIIDGHDSRKDALSLNDRIVKDADKLWRYSKEGFYIDIKRFEETFEQGMKRLESSLDEWFFTGSAKEMARQELIARRREEIANHHSGGSHD